MQIECYGFHVPQMVVSRDICRPLRYEKVYLPLCQVADTPFYIQGANYVDPENIPVSGVVCLLHSCSMVLDDFPVKRRHGNNVGTMSCQRRRRWTNIISALGSSLVFDKLMNHVYFSLVDSVHYKNVDDVLPRIRSSCRYKYIFYSSFA